MRICLTANEYDMASWRLCHEFAFFIGKGAVALYGWKDTSFTG